MNRKLLALVLAGLLAVAGVVSVVSYARGADARAYGDAELVPVLVVSQPVPAGSPASRLTGSVETEEVPRAVRVQDAVTDLASLGGKVTTADLVPGEQVLQSRFGDAVKPVDASALPAGMQQIDLILNPPRVPSGTKAGDTVGLFASYPGSNGAAGVTRMALSKVRVMAVSKNAVGEAGAEATAVGVRVTLAVSTPQAEKVANAIEFGKIWLTSQNAKADVKGSVKTNAKVVLR